MQHAGHDDIKPCFAWPLCVHSALHVLTCTMPCSIQALNVISAYKCTCKHCPCCNACKCTIASALHVPDFQNWRMMQSSGSQLDSNMPRHAVLCCARYAVLCNAMACYAVICYAMLCRKGCVRVALRSETHIKHVNHMSSAFNRRGH